MKKTVAPLMFLTLLACVVAPLAFGVETDEEYIRLHYTKYEYKIPMRDGVKLFTAVYVPNDESETYPFILFRTPYAVSPYGANASAPPSARTCDLPARATSLFSRMFGAGSCPRVTSST